MFKSLGENATIYSLAKILYPENISIGAESVVDDFVFMYGAGKGIQIGKFCHITYENNKKIYNILPGEIYRECRFTFRDSTPIKCK